jgi:hypothetical protein
MKKNEVMNLNKIKDRLQKEIIQEKMEWMTVLMKYKREPTEIQLANKKEIVSAIKEMIDTNPTEEDFSMYLGGIVLFPETIYYLFKNKEE